MATAVIAISPKLRKLYTEYNQISGRLEVLSVTYNDQLSLARSYQNECKSEMNMYGKPDPAHYKTLKETMKRVTQLNQEVSRLRYRMDNLQRLIVQEEQRCNMRQIAHEEKFVASQQRKAMRLQQRAAERMMKGRY